jgi:hypothetical protein
VSANATDLNYHGGRAHNLSAGKVDPFAHKRGAGELVPRPNAAGDLNVTTISHGFGPTSPGFAMVPGGLFPPGGFGIGALPVVNAQPGAATNIVMPAMPTNGTCPPGMHLYQHPQPSCAPGELCPELMYALTPTCQPNTTSVPPPWQNGGGMPAPITSHHCPPGMYHDSAGNCVSQWTSPYPISQPAQPSPIVPGPTSGTPSAGQPGCVTGQFDSQGNCVAGTVPGAQTPSWFDDPNQDLIPNLPNWGLLAIAGGGLLLLSGMMGGKHK